MAVTAAAGRIELLLAQNVDRLHQRIGSDFSGFEVPACSHCAGILKPDVVFFGENVLRPRVQAATDALAASDAMLVVGSSLMVRSGLRFVEAANARGKPVAAINLGKTRADELLALKVEAACGEVLEGAVEVCFERQLRGFD